MRSSRSALTDYLTHAFEAAFDTRPREVEYESFPEGLFAGLLVPGRPATEHNVWAVTISAVLRDIGVNVNVFVRSTSELEEAERVHLETETEVRDRIRSRRRRA